MATSRPLTTDENIWCFEVTHPVKHIKGFTIYQVSCKIIHISAPEKITEIVVWKRYNDFKQLYKSTITLHKALHRKEEFPEFAKPKFFGRFSESVIEERRTSALELLNFIGRQKHLYKSQVFQKFLETSENDECNTAEERSNPVSIRPTKAGGGGSSSATAETSSFESDSELSVDLSSSDANKSYEVLTLNQQESYHENSNKQENHISLKTSTSASDICNGVWGHHQIPDNISITSMEDEELEELDGDVGVVLGTPLGDADISYFDPLQQNQEEAVGTNQEETVNPDHERETNNMWLLSALTTNALPFSAEMQAERLVLDPDKDEMPEKHLEERNSFHCHPLMPSKATADSRSPVEESEADKKSQIDISAFDPLEDASNVKVSYTKGDFDISLNLPPLNTQPDSPEGNQNLSSSTVKPSAGYSPKIQRSRSSPRPNEMSLKVGGKEDYIYVAANQICQAQECEASGRHEMAFDFYRNGVGILLQGVQGDGNKARREAVRRKTAQYLMKAEDLYNRHLAKDSNDDRRWALDCTVSPPMELDPTLAFLRAPLCELRNYKVLGTIDKVLLVLERGTNETYVMKTIHKSGNERLDVKNILPSSCPFMVQLHKFYEGIDAIYLLLQLASGGKLWKYISSYLQTGAQDNFTDYSASGSAGGRNVYKGCKLHNSSTFHEQLPNYNPQENFPAAGSTHPTTAGLQEDLMDQNIEVQEKTDADSCVAVFSNRADSEHVQFINTNSKHYSQDLLTRNQAEQHESIRAQRCSEFSISEYPVDTVEVVPAARSSEAFVLNTDLGTAGRFRDLLTKTEHHLGNFSITSNDSSEVHSQRHSSGFSETIGTILEGVEMPPSHSPKKDKTEIKVDPLDEVFVNPTQEAGDAEEVEPNSNPIKETSDVVLDTAEFNADDKLCGDSSISVIKTDSNSASTSCVSENNGAFSDNESDREAGLYDPYKCGESLLKVGSVSPIPLLKSEDFLNVGSVSPKDIPLSKTVDKCGEGFLRVGSVSPTPFRKSEGFLKVGSVSPKNIPLSKSVDKSGYGFLKVGSVSPIPLHKSEFLKVGYVSPTPFLKSEDFLKVGSVSPKESFFPRSVDQNYEDSRPHSLGALPLYKKDLARPVATSNQGTDYRTVSGIDPAHCSENTASGFSMGRHIEPNTIHKHSFTEVCRSASFENNLKSPSKSKSRRVFEDLDSIGNGSVETLLPESCIRNWAAEIVVALSYLHAQGIICRDLKPANVLLGDRGHIMISYFCQMNNVEKLLDEWAVENMYTAPELRSISSYTEVCDWWSFGALLYELLSGKRLSSSHPGGITSHTQLLIPTHLSKEAQGLLEELLCYNPRERLGSGINGAEDIKVHPFFADIDWNSLENNYN